jgi:hypothetical protein
MNPAPNSSQKASVLTNITELSTAWLTAVLGHKVAGVRSEEMTGEGYNSRLYRLRLSGGADLPESLVLKLMTSNTTISNVLASDEMFREVHSYRVLSEDIAHILPQIHFAEMDVEAGAVTILMEDVGNVPHHAFWADLDESVTAVRLLARLHAHYWADDDPRLAPFNPLEFELGPALEALNHSLTIAVERDQVFDYLNDCIRHVIKLAPFLVENPPGRSDGTSTIIHGDFHCRNIYLGNEREILFDWQSTQRGNGAQDLAYWMITSVDVDDRPSFEPVLLRAYHQQLTAEGVMDYSLGQLYKDYREIFGLLIPVVFCYQSILEIQSEEEDAEFGQMLGRMDSIAREIRMLNKLRVARVLTSPPILPLLRLLQR